MENGHELFAELLNLYCKDKISLEEFYKLQNLLNKILEENYKMKNSIINKLKYYIPIFGACALWFYICIGILVG